MLAEGLQPGLQTAAFLLGPHVPSSGGRTWAERSSEVSSSSCKGSNPRAGAPPPQPHLPFTLGVRASTHGLGWGGGHIQSLTLVRTWTGCLSSSWHRPEWFSSGDGPPALPSGFTEGSPPGSPASEHWVLPGHGVTRSGPGAPSSLRICACGLAAFLESPQNTKCLPTRLPHCPVPGAAFCPSCAFGVCVWGGDGNLQ